MIMNKISKERVIELLESVRGGVSLSIDGNAGCALLGVNLQEGEAEFVTIDEDELKDGYKVAAKRAMIRALNKLRRRCEDYGQLPYNTFEAPEFH